MADIIVNASQLPFVLGENGYLTVHLGATALDKPLPPNADVVFDLETKASGRNPLALGGAGSWTITLKATAGITIHVVWPSSTAAVAKYEFSPHFATHPGDVVLVLTVGADADGRFGGEFRYAPIVSTATFEARGDLSFTYARSYPGQLPLGELVEKFLGDVRLPATVRRPIESGEVIAFEYGGYLGLGGSLGIGYEIRGTPSVEIGELRLAEHYGLTLAGRIGVSARIGGFFSVEMRAALEGDDRPMPGWTRVVVRKRRSSAFAFAADASAHITSELERLPAAPHEFLGAMLGVNLRSWLALLDRVRGVTDLDRLLAECDELAVAFLAAWIDRQLDPRSLKTLVDAANSLVRKYGAIDVTVMTAFERHFDPVASPPHITAALETLSRLRSWSDLEGEPDSILWDLANELTGGDALGWIAEKPVGEMQERASHLLALGNPSLHPELHTLAGLVKRQFSTEPLLAELRGIRTVEDLKAQAGKRLDGLVQRLLGDAVMRLEATGLGQGLARLHEVLDRIDGFEKAAYARFTEAAKQAVVFDLHAEYSRASDNDALLDIAIDTSRREGLDLLRAAAHGDFAAALAVHQPDLVRINAGRLTHRLTRKRAVSVNIVGWHAAWRYQGIERVILRTDQQLISDDRGNLTAHTTVDLTRSKDRKRSQERIATNFLLRFIGESRGILEPDPKNLEYLIDSLVRMAATYDLSFVDDRTTGAELAYYLGFAKDFGLAMSVQPEAVAAVLPRAGPDDFGRLTATYDVRYQSSGLLKLFTQPVEEAAIRHTMRKVTLASYLRVGGHLARLGWAYWTPATKRFFETLPAQSFAGMSSREFRVAPSPFAGVTAPPSVVLQGPQLETLRTIYLIEEAFARSLLTLEALIRGGRRLSPRELEQRLGDVATALGLLDRFGESVNTVFAVFDALLRDVAGAERASSLKIQSEAAGITMTKLFLAG